MAQSQSKPLAKVQFGEVEINTPVFFASISSLKTKVSLLKALQHVVRVSKAQYFLISSYDYIHPVECDSDEKINQYQSNVQSETKELIESGLFLLLDSGNYEASWKSKGVDATSQNQKKQEAEQPDGKWKPSDHHQAIADLDVSFVFGFDLPDDKSDKKEKIKKYVKLRQEDLRKYPYVIPILHAQPADLPWMCFQFVRHQGVSMFAIAERDLGGSLIQRALNLRRIRKAIDKFKPNIGIHLLGTGDPLSIAVYAIEGANTFDGLEWCRVAIDSKGKTHPFSHGGLFYDDLDLQFYEYHLMIKNLNFMTKWMEDLRNDLHIGNGYNFVKKFLQNTTSDHLVIYEKLRSSLDW